MPHLTSKRAPSPRSQRAPSPDSRAAGRLRAAFVLWTAVSFFGLYLLAFVPHDHGCAADSDCTAADTAADCSLCHVAAHQPVSAPQLIVLTKALESTAPRSDTSSLLEAPPAARYRLPLLRAPPAA